MGVPPEIFPKFGGWSQRGVAWGALTICWVRRTCGFAIDCVVHTVRYGHNSNFQLTIFAVVLSELKKNLDSGVVLGG